SNNLDACAYNPSKALTFPAITNRFGDIRENTENLVAATHLKQNNLGNKWSGKNQRGDPQTTLELDRACPKKREKLMTVWWPWDGSLRAGGRSDAPRQPGGEQLNKNEYLRGGPAGPTPDEQPKTEPPGD
ncbi:hypothetical protein BaRGS_00038183, partial [Batillaria attramentaria]